MLSPWASFVNTLDNSFDRGFVGPDITSPVAAVEESAVDRRNASRRPAWDFLQDGIVGTQVLLRPIALTLSKAVFTHHGPVRNRRKTGVDLAVARHREPVFPPCVLLAAGSMRIPGDASREVLASIGGVRIPALPDIAVRIAVSDPVMPTAELQDEIV